MIATPATTPAPETKADPMVLVPLSAVRAARDVIAPLLADRPDLRAAWNALFDAAAGPGGWSTSRAPKP